MNFCQGLRKKSDRFAFLKYITRSWFCVLNIPNILRLLISCGKKQKFIILLSSSFLKKLLVIGQTPFYRTSNKLEHHFSNIERTFRVRDFTQSTLSTTKYGKLLCMYLILQICKNIWSIFKSQKKMHSQKFTNVCTRSFYAFASKPENLAFKAVIVHIQ